MYIHCYRNRQYKQCRHARPILHTQIYNIPDPITQLSKSPFTSQSCLHLRFRLCLPMKCKKIRQLWKVFEKLERRTLTPQELEHFLNNYLRDLKTGAWEGIFSITTVLLVAQCDYDPGLLFETRRSSKFKKIVDSNIWIWALIELHILLIKQPY